jgi:hypothetical protein
MVPKGQIELDYIFKPGPQDDIPGIIEGTPPKDTRRHGG